MAPPPASGFSKNPNFSIPDAASSTQQNPSKSNSNTLTKSLVIVLILLVIPLFPSQAPDFISQSVLNGFWEIFHLLFIGIAVSYGLFSKKSDETVAENVVQSRNDGSHNYISEMSSLTSIFEDGFENICGSDEQILRENYANFQYLRSSDNQLLDEKVRSFVSKSGGDDINEGNVKGITQAWRSRYSMGEPLVMVSHGKYIVDESPELKPLNLPVRSLRSTVVDNGRLELTSTFNSTPGIEASRINDIKVVKIRGMVPKNLEKRFEEVSEPSLIPWRSRSMRDIRNKGEMGNFEQSSHYRPHSVGEFEFEHLKSASSDTAMSKVENAENRNNVGDISIPPPKINKPDVEVLFNGARIRPNSIGSSLEINQLKNSEFSWNIYDDNGNFGKEKSLALDMKPPGLIQVLSKAKSVRTTKPSSYEDRKFELDLLLKRGVRESNDPQVKNHKYEVDGIVLMQKLKPILPEIQDEGEEDVDYSNVTDSEVEKFDESSDEDDIGTNHESDAECLGSEVDRKAGEFIAKFKEQIRLQRLQQRKVTFSGGH